jgi:hypothetical protein
MNEEMKTFKQILSKHSKNYAMIEDNPRAIVKASEAIEANKEYTKQLLEEYTNKIVENVGLTTTYIDDVYDSNFEDTTLPNEEIFLITDGDGMPYAANKVTINKESITSQLGLMLKELGI